MNDEKKSTLMFTASGIVAGYVSFLSGNNYYALIVLIIGFVATAFAIQKLMGKRKGSWIFANGGLIYILFWFVIWVLFYNL